ncbi:serine--tRNA ligase [Candidatus Profftella armatura (Diaphorina cf. continua)]|uniref:Serine--tRNA ligase n=1 Tax=Candidatus Profftella armatura (Diaphorina cf. continua) TaxID=2661583 RepID=A0A7R6VYZ1_9PROT|nr:serine--tRNA ligase [Candidatus Profftella armatura (Diaphorina cf. continua)]BCG49611.1 serine--tRNA ligase [Candidatus Profftella armatura (Diaphorina cf. continua)]
MIDIKLLRKNINTIASILSTRNFFLDINEFHKIELERKKIQLYTENLRNKRKKISQKIGQIKNTINKDLITSMTEEVIKIGNDLKVSSEKLKKIQLKLNQFILSIPNLPHKTIPIGLKESDNLELRQISNPPIFNFLAKDHVDLGMKLGLDFDSAIQMTSSRFSVLKGGIASLHRALTQFMLNTHISDHGYTECYIPYIVNENSLYGTGQLPKFEDDLFIVKRGGNENKVDEKLLYLIPTAEVPLLNLFRNQIICFDTLPIKLTAYSPCFRSESRSYGSDTRGIIRQHQFDKVEIVQIVNPDDSYQVLEEMLGHIENILKKLGLVYRIITLCTGQIGFSSAKTYDIEVWFPGQNIYREISSISNCEDFQARRLKSRFRKNREKTQEMVHTLNGSGLAVGRTLAALLENFQRKDGNIDIPSVLHPYMNGVTSLKKITNKNNIF